MSRQTAAWRYGSFQDNLIASLLPGGANETCQVLIVWKVTAFNDGHSLVQERITRHVCGGNRVRSACLRREVWTKSRQNAQPQPPNPAIHQIGRCDSQGRKELTLHLLLLRQKLLLLLRRHMTQCRHVGPTAR